MPNTPAFAPPAWVAALLVRAPPAPPAKEPAQPRATPSAMRDLVAQWLVHVTADAPPRPVQQRAPVLARFRGWFALVFRIPTIMRRRAAQQPRLPPQLPSPQWTLIERSLYFSSNLQDVPAPTDAVVQPQQKKTPKRTKVVKQAQEPPLEKVNLTPLYKSLYFAIADTEGHRVPSACKSPARSQSRKERVCVQPFFLMDDSAEGKGILEGLKEMQSKSRERQRKHGWVPGLVSLILIALNPLK